MKKNTVLSVSGLVTHFFVPDGVVKAVDGIDFDIDSEEIVAIVGESGSGKSVTALSIMRLIAEPGRIIAGSIFHHDRDLLSLKEKDMQAVRGRSISMVFQDPYASLHPMIKIRQQLVETIALHKGVDEQQAYRETLSILERIGIENAGMIVENYPHEVSAGVCQRVMFAMALIARPALLIADEPTTNLDAMAQMQFLELVKRMRDEMHMSVLIITHDFGVVSMMADKVIVMYAGKQIESGPAPDVLHGPSHPYTSSLLNSVRVLSRGKGRRLEQIPGEVPDVMRLPPGCSFRPRCALARKNCGEMPPTSTIAGSHTVRCWFPHAVNT